MGCSETELIIKPSNLVSLEGISDPNERERNQYQENFGGKPLCYGYRKVLATGSRSLILPHAHSSARMCVLSCTTQSTCMFSKQSYCGELISRKMST